MLKSTSASDFGFAGMHHGKWRTRYLATRVPEESHSALYKLGFAYEMMCIMVDVIFREMSDALVLLLWR